MASKSPYLQSERSNEILEKLANCILATQSGNKEAQQLKLLANKLSGKYSQWSTVLLKANQKRVIPVHSHQSITRLNTAWTNEIEEVNQHRVRQQNLTKDDINVLKIQISKNLENQDRRESDFMLAETKFKAFIDQQAQRPNATQAEIDTAEKDRQVAEGFRDGQLSRYRLKYNALQTALKEVEDQLIPIRMLSTQQSAKYWFIKSANHRNLGFVPGLGKYVLIQNSVLPPEQEIMRHIAVCPTSSLVNLPLSVYHLIQWAHEIGADDKMLMNILVIFITKHKRYLLEILNAHKSNLHNFITQLGYHIDTAQEKQKAKEYIYAFCLLVN